MTGYSDFSDYSDKSRSGNTDRRSNAVNAAPDIWNKALAILKYDSRIDPIIYDSILKHMKQVDYTDSGILILSCRDEYSMSLVKGRDLDKFVNDGIHTAYPAVMTVKYIEEGDMNAYNSTLISNRMASAISDTSASAVSSDNSCNLNNDYTFENFIVGDCNRFAYASAVAVSDNPGSKQRNPLYLWGYSGLGKTHLMKAVGYRIKQNFPEKNVLYTTCEDFTNAFVACIPSKNYNAFRNKYRNVDVLMIDDIQFLIGKEGTQSEFFNTFEALVNAGKQIVITSDKAPKNLTELDMRLISRFQSGILMDIQPPDFETRKAIILKKISDDGYFFSSDIVDYICENITKNVRELNGAYNMLSSYYALMNGSIDLETVKKLLSSLISPNIRKKVTVEIIIDAVSKFYAISPDKIVSKLRNAEIVNARNVAMYLCRDLLEMQYEKIGKCFGGKRHTTVMSSCDKVENSESLLSDVEDIKKRILDS